VPALRLCQIAAVIARRSWTTRVPILGHSSPTVTRRVYAHLMRTTTADHHAEAPVVSGPPASPPPYGPPVYQQVVVGQSPQTSGWATASLVFGMLGVLGGWCLFAVPCMAAVICGHAGLRDTNGGMKGGRGMAVAGFDPGLPVRWAHDPDRANGRAWFRTAWRQHSP
jgi:hypothetical protein